MRFSKYLPWGTNLLELHDASSISPNKAAKRQPLKNRIRRDKNIKAIFTKINRAIG
jgi:hypothetical protein